MVKPATGGAPEPTDAAPPPLALNETNGAVSFSVRVTPRSSREVLSVEEGQARAWLRAAPVDGAANAALIALLAKQLGVPRSAVSIVRGDTARLKQIAIRGVSAETLRQRFAALASGGQRT